MVQCLGPDGQLLPLDKQVQENDLYSIVQLALYLGQRFNNLLCGIHNIPLVFDTGASNGLAPFQADFLTYFSADFEVKGVAGSGRIIGQGLVLQRFTTHNGHQVHVKLHAVHMLTADIHLESPQVLFSNLGGQSNTIVSNKGIVWTLPDGAIIDISFNLQSNLPLLLDFFCTADKK